MSTVTWPENFISHFTVEQIDRMEYLTGTPAADGTFPCKVCGPTTGAREKHFEQHSCELRRFVEKRAEDIKQARLNALHPNGKAKPKQEKSEFYEKPCVSCGAQIPRTGKRGKPPVKCVECKAAKVSPVAAKCAGKKSDGSACGMKPVNGSTFCRWHQEEK